jgi:hypothetical protein
MLSVLSSYLVLDRDSVTPDFKKFRNVEEDRQKDDGQDVEPGKMGKFNIELIRFHNASFSL